jgi:hypothetical protein
LAQYTNGEAFWIREHEGDLILNFALTEIDQELYDPGEYLSVLFPLRDELLRGDARVLYLGWLFAVLHGSVGEEEEEPVIPANLGQLTEAQQGFVDFFCLDEDLVAEAAEASAVEEVKGPKRSEIVSWVADLAADEKDAVLVNLIVGDDQQRVATLRSRFFLEKAPKRSDKPALTRTAGSLIKAAEIRSYLRKRAKTRAELVRRIREAERAREARRKFIISLIGNESKLWAHVESLVATRKPKCYDEAVTVIRALCELAAYENKDVEFFARLSELKEGHAKKESFLRRLTEIAGTEKELIATTQKAISRATRIDEKRRNSNFPYDVDAYQLIKSNLSHLLETGAVAEAMGLAIELMAARSAQVEASDEGLMLEELEECLGLVIETIEVVDLPKEEKVLWCDRLRSADRVRFVCEKAIQSLRRAFS